MTTQQTPQLQRMTALAALVLKVARETGDKRPAGVIVAPLLARRTATKRH